MFNRERRMKHKGELSDFMSHMKGVINVFRKGIANRFYYRK